MHFLCPHQIPFFFEAGKIPDFEAVPREKLLPNSITAPFIWVEGSKIFTSLSLAPIAYHPAGHGHRFRLLAAAFRDRFHTSADRGTLEHSLNTVFTTGSRDFRHNFRTISTRKHSSSFWTDGDHHLSQQQFLSDSSSLRLFDAGRSCCLARTFVVLTCFGRLLSYSNTRDFLTFRFSGFQRAEPMQQKAKRRLQGLLQIEVEHEPIFRADPTEKNILYTLTTENPNLGSVYPNRPAHSGLLLIFSSFFPPYVLTVE